MPKHCIKLSIRLEHLGYVASINGIDNECKKLYDALAFIRNVHLRFNRYYPIELTDNCTLQLSKGEYEFAIGKADTIIYY